MNPRRVLTALTAAVSCVALTVPVGSAAWGQQFDARSDAPTAATPAPVTQLEQQPEQQPEATPYAVTAQRALRSLHCNPGPVRPRVSERTRAAVTRFQSASDLRQSGRLDLTTRQALRSADAADCLARPLPARSGQGRRVVVSQSQNFLWMVGPGGKAFHRAPVVDNPDVLSPGTWSTGSYCGRAARVWQNSDLTYTEWLYGFVRFAPCGIGFHRIPIWKDTGKQIHPDWWLGTDKDASQGCIRLDRRTMQKVWDFTGRATTTVVVLP